MAESDVLIEPNPVASHGPVMTRAPGRSALVWDSTNTSAVVVGRALQRLGWRVHWLGTAVSLWKDCTAFDGERILVRDLRDDALLRAFHALEVDALFLHGDDQVRWMLDHWDALPARARASVSGPEALRTALSKDESMQLAASLGVPTLRTARCTSPAEVAVESQRLAPGGEVVLKGDGGAAGMCVAAVRAGSLPDPTTWARVTRHSPVALVQRRIRGRKVDLTTVYEHGVERATCLHEKVGAFPHAFGPTAFAVSQHVDVVLDDANRMLRALQWHGFANIEFRQDEVNGEYYFMEINPRVNASMGIADAAGIDLVRAWTGICTGRGDEYSPGRNYRDGVRFAWGARGLALALRRPWSVPRWGLPTLLDGHTDLVCLDPVLRRRALRLAFWMARHANSR